MLTTSLLPDERAAIRASYFSAEAASVRRLLSEAPPEAARRRMEQRALALVRDLRARPETRLMEEFLAEYGLSTTEGIALMCLAEALLRVPDAPTVDALIRDKIAPADWSRHLGSSSSPLVNASTWGLMLTGRVLSEDVTGAMRGLLRRAGEPVVRRAVGQAIRLLGDQFVLGETIDEALGRADREMRRGYLHSFDMLGEAARTDADAQRYFRAYEAAITAIARRCRGEDARANPGISVKLSALHPRYETGSRGRVMQELVPRVTALAQQARAAGMGFNIDAEEQDRLELSLDVIEAVLSDPALAGWNGFGAVVQAYGRRAPEVLDWFTALAARLGRQVMVRLVKGAYWDSEIKRAQVLGVAEYPVYTRKASTDAAYIVCAQKLLAARDVVYPQFATHNAHTIAAVLELAGNGGESTFEFQRLHGMGEALHARARDQHGQRVRIYAPVGLHEDLLAYLVRRLLENGANSSFVHQLLDPEVPPERIARDPFAVLASLGGALANPTVPTPPNLFADRRNARGWNLAEPAEAESLLTAMAPWCNARWGTSAGRMISNPADRQDVLGTVADASEVEIDEALGVASGAASAWAARDAGDRATLLERAADLYEANAPELIALCAREAGKTLQDGVAELREAVDFLRYYAVEARRLDPRLRPWGVFACISPWNFPLAIFTGQVAAALAAGNAVLAKPAEQTPLIAARAVALLYEAGVPPEVLHLLQGDGRVGASIVSDARVGGVCFTGSIETARRIEGAMARHLDPGAPFIAETGGLNAMIVDSTALPEQAVRDAVASAFQSAGQRCSAARLLCVQEDVAEPILRMLAGAMAELSVGDPWQLATDVGPVIDDEARAAIETHCARLDAEGRRLVRLDLPPACEKGSFVAPAAYRLDAVEALQQEVFGPVLHVTTYRAHELDALVGRINAQGYGLTLGLHTRLDDRVRRVVEKARVGNIYVNRNQIGAVVGVQPFGGEGLSGTGPKAGGPHYLLRFTRPAEPDVGDELVPDQGDPVDPALAARLHAAQPGWDRTANRPALLAQAAEACGPEISRAVELALSRATALREPEQLPGPVGESNRLSLHGRGLALVLGADPDRVLAAAVMALALGNTVLASDSPALAALCSMLPGVGACAALGLDAVRDLAPDLVVLDAGAPAQRRARCLLAEREGSIAPLVIGMPEPYRLVVERTVSVDLTAAGGNAQLLAAAEQDAVLPQSPGA